MKMQTKEDTNHKKRIAHKHTNGINEKTANKIAGKDWFSFMTNHF